MNTKLYEVEITLRSVVEAYDEKHALTVVMSLKNDIARDACGYSADFDVGNEIEGGDRLPSGWTADCYPYSDCFLSQRTIEQILKVQDVNP